MKYLSSIDKDKVPTLSFVLSLTSILCCFSICIYCATHPVCTCDYLQIPAKIQVRSPGLPTIVIPITSNYTQVIAENGKFGYCDPETNLWEFYC